MENRSSSPSSTFPVFACETRNGSFACVSTAVATLQLVVYLLCCAKDAMHVRVWLARAEILYLEQKSTASKSYESRVFVDRGSQGFGRSEREKSRTRQFGESSDLTSCDLHRLPGLATIMTTPIDLTALHQEYAAHGLRRVDLDPDPIKQFSAWFTAAIEAGIPDVNAMSLGDRKR